MLEARETVKHFRKRKKLERARKEWLENEEVNRDLTLQSLINQV